MAIENGESLKGVLAVHDMCTMGAIECCSLPGGLCDPSDNIHKDKINTGRDIFFVKCSLHFSDIVFKYILHFWVWALVGVDGYSPRSL